MARVRNVFAEARARFEAGAFTLSDFDALETAVIGQTPRQRLLYLYAQQPTVRASIVAATLQEPAGYGPGIGQIEQTPVGGHTSLSEADIEAASAEMVEIGKPGRDVGRMVLRQNRNSCSETDVRRLRYQAGDEQVV